MTGKTALVGIYVRKSMSLSFMIYIDKIKDDDLFSTKVNQGIERSSVPL